MSFLFEQAARSASQNTGLNYSAKPFEARVAALLQLLKLCGALALPFWAMSCGSIHTGPELPIPTDPDLQQGFSVYKASCATCHDRGMGNAPRIGFPKLWEERIAQGMDTLYRHSIQGYPGKLGTMPAKGGSFHLTDGEVKAAVRYMVHYCKAENLPPAPSIHE